MPCRPHPRLTFTLRAGFVKLAGGSLPSWLLPWYLVTACPNALGMQVMQRLQTQGLQQKARAKKLAGELRDPLLSQIKALLAKRDRLQADKAYQKATGADLTTADSVMDAIRNPKN